jgi:PHD/YefM family antitoxin component YafN of YafNO toxin-antitoxin module
MKKINAVELRRSLGKVLSALQKSGEPILLELRKKPVGVLISMRDFEERFAEKAAARARDRILEQMDKLAMPSKNPESVVKILRELRSSNPR